MIEINLFVPYENYIKSYALKQESLDDYLTHIEEDIKSVVSYLYENDFLNLELKLLILKQKIFEISSGDLKKVS